MSDIESVENEEGKLEGGGGGVEETKGDDNSESEEENTGIESEDADIVEQYDDDELQDDELIEDDENEEVEDPEIKINSTKASNNVPNNNGYQYFENSSESDTDESESESEDEYISKVDIEKKMEYIKETHTQEISKTYEEMVTLTKIDRKKNKTGGEDIIVDNKHTTVPILTKYEKTRILGIRVSQLNEGAPRYINFGNNQPIIDNNIIAEKELRMKKLPFIVTRPLPNGEKEHWRLKDLEVL